MTPHAPKPERVTHPVSALERLRPRLRRSFSTRRVPDEAIVHLMPGTHTPRAGDLVLVRIDAIGQHRRLELPTGRKSDLQVGDNVIVAYGSRYAPDQFEGVLPDASGACHLVAAGGLAARAVAANAAMKPATEISVLGVVCDAEGAVVNLSACAIPAAEQAAAAAKPVICVCGSSMNAGKTHTMVDLVRGLSNAGLRVGAAKLTGTGAGGDLWRLQDAGASPVMDFTDAGLPSTYQYAPDDVEDAAGRLLDTLQADPHVDVIVAEIADGIGHTETAALLRSALVRDRVDHVVFAASDPMAARAGVDWMREHGKAVSVVSGLTTATAHDLAETHALVNDVRVLDSAQLRGGILVLGLLPSDISRKAINSVAAGLSGSY